MTTHRVVPPSDPRAIEEYATLTGKGEVAYRLTVYPAAERLGTVDQLPAIVPAGKPRLAIVR